MRGVDRAYPDVLWARFDPQVPRRLPDMYHADLLLSLCAVAGCVHDR